MVYGQCYMRRLTAEEESKFLLTQDESDNFVHIFSKILLTPKELLGEKMDIVRRRLNHDCTKGEHTCHQHPNQGCTPCGPGKYQNLNQHQSSECKDCITTCGSGTKFSKCKKTTATFRRDADGSCPVCESGQYQDANSHSSTSCKFCVICKSFTTTDCIPTTDTVCGCAATQVANSNKAATGSITGTLNNYSEHDSLLLFCLFHFSYI
jgi:hypothetical protein